MVHLRSLFTSVSLLAISHTLIAEEDKPIWKPEVGDSWTYSVTVEVQEGSKLPENVEGQKIEKLDGKLRATFTQQNVYKGLQTLSQEGPEMHAFYVSNGKELVEIQYMKITDTLVGAVGVKQEGDDPKPLVPLSKVIPLMESSWKGGEGFPFTMANVVDGRQVRMVRKFKVLGWETLETKAGKFNAMHVQVTGKNGLIELQRSYWFAPQVGFIKEVKKYYAGEKTILSQIRTLDKIGKK